MGIEELQKIEDLLKDSPAPLSTTMIHKKLEMNYNTVKESITYLHEQGKVIVVWKGGRDEGKNGKWKWKK